MSHINNILIRNFRGIKYLSQNFGEEKFIVLIGRGDSGKSTILSAINLALSPSWNIVFSDLDFYMQDTTNPIEIEITLTHLPCELLRESKFGLYVINDLSEECNASQLSIVLKLIVDETLEPHWVIKARPGSDIDDKTISAQDRGLLAVNYITDYTDNQFSYNRQSPLYALTKYSLPEGATIERIKSQIIRSMTSSISEQQLEQLNIPLVGLKTTAEKLGLKLTDIYAQVDIKENPYTGNSIALHDQNLPFRLHGKGTKRLMSIAIQTELTKQGGIVLIDELEQGLEPDRIITLVRILKDTTEGQVFITTHSLNVVLEAEWHNLYVINKGVSTLSLVSQDLDDCRRSNPQAFFAKKVICCEGKTEQGFIRALDSWLFQHYNSNFSAKGIVIVNAGGGNKMYTYAEKLSALGYDACVFADDDKYIELKESKELAISANIPLFLCQEGNCLEAQIFLDFPWNSLTMITTCKQENFINNSINFPDKETNNLGMRLSLEDEKNIRNQLANIASDKRIFKDIPGGEILGKVVMEVYLDLSEECTLKKNIKNLLTWCDFQI